MPFRNVFIRLPFLFPTLSSPELGGGSDERLVLIGEGT
jgi:hypothetical protein